MLRSAVDILHLELDPLPAEVGTLLTLPMRHGGFGLRSMMDTASAAFLGSLATAARHLPPPELLRDTPLAREIEHALSLCQVPRLRLPAANAFLACAARRPPKALQHVIASAIEDFRMRSVDSAPGLSSHLLSLRQTGASNWLTAIPSRPEHSLPNGDFYLAARLRLRLTPCPSIYVTHCA